MERIAASEAMTAAVQLQSFHLADPEVRQSRMPNAIVKLIAHATSEDAETDQARAALIEAELRSYLDIAPLPCQLVPAIYGYEASHFKEIKFNENGCIILDDLKQENTIHEPIHCINRVPAAVAIPSRYLPGGRKHAYFNNIVTRFKKGLEALNIRGNRLINLDLAVKIFIPMSSAEERIMVNYLHVTTAEEAQRVVQYVPIGRNPIYIQLGQV